MAYDSITFVKKEGYAVLTLARPEKLNSLTGEVHHEIRDALDAFDADGAVRALLLTGAGRGFCAGQDLGDPLIGPQANGKPDLGLTLHDNYTPLIKRLRTMREPVICAVNGAAAGVGVALALACDLVLAAKSARFFMSFLQVGLIPDGGATWTLPRLIGRQRLAGAYLTGEPIDAETAQAWGMIWKAVEADDLMTHAEELTQRLAGAPTGAIGLFKQALAASSANSLDAQLDLERDLQRAAGESGDFAEGVAAFKESRKPRFTGD